MKRTHYLIAMIALLAVALCSCDKKNNDEEVVEVYSTSTTNALLKSFSLQNSPNVSAKLDSVHFTIDPVRGEVYNVDSLPVGTNVSALLTRATFASSVGQARYFLTYSKGGTVHRDTITYSSTSTDSLNFTGTARLELSSFDGTVTRSYNIHVNVHKSQPDTLSWPQTSRRDLPGSGDQVVAQRTVKWNNLVVCLVQSGNGCKVSLSDELIGNWDTKSLVTDFTPDVNSLAACGELLCLLDTEGLLHTTTDMQTWTNTGVRWRTIIGGYNTRLLGISDADVPMLDEYPRRADFQPQPIPAGFPMSGLSQLVTTDNKWTVAQQALMVGGRLADGSVTNKTWGYDGSTWAVVSNNYNALPALRDAILVSYYTHRVNIINYKTTLQETWLVMGGFKADGTPNRTTYTSINQGITWSAGEACMQWPGHLPSMGGALALVINRTFTANGAPRRVSKPVTEWEVPYIYLFGGWNETGQVFNNIWCGVINRLTYQPVY